MSVHHWVSVEHCSPNANSCAYEGLSPNGIDDHRRSAGLQLNRISNFEFTAHLVLQGRKIMLQSVETAYHIGQTVYLKSGSPALTVIASEDGRTSLKWQGDASEQQTTLQTVYLKPTPSMDLCI